MTCPICNDRFVIAVSGPDENGQYDTDDCPCQIVPGFDAEEYLRELADGPH